MPAQGFFPVEFLNLKMGIVSINEIVRQKSSRCFTSVRLTSLKNHRIGVDAAIWLHANMAVIQKKTVMKMGKDIGFDPVDAGPLKSARYLESMAMLIIDLAYTLGMGTNIGYKLVKG